MSEQALKRWEYKKVALNEAPHKRDDIDLLCDVGKDEWELIAVLSNGIAYLKRELNEDETFDRDEPTATTHEVKAKYCDPVTGETWSGRGRMASWLKRKQDAGEDIEKYLV